jgi:hypothetical protein
VFYNDNSDNKVHFVVSQALIQWSGQLESFARWEDFDELKQCFPRSPSWGQAIAQGRGIVSDTSDKQGPLLVVERERQARKESTKYPPSRAAH